MTFSLLFYYKRGKYILYHEGWSELLKKAFISLKDWFYNRENYVIYQSELNVIHSFSTINLPPEYSLKLIYNTNDYDQLVNQGFDFKMKNIFPLLKQGTLLFCIFDKNTIIYTHWIATSENSKQMIDRVPFKVDFKNGEVCSGDVFTEPAYRRKGLDSYIHSILPYHLTNLGFKILKYSFQKGNTPQEKIAVKINAQYLGEWRYFKILFWESWKEISMKR